MAELTLKFGQVKSRCKGTYLPSVTSASYQANCYAERFLREIEVVFGRGNVVIDPKIPNLIVAQKKTNLCTSKIEIKAIQKISQHEVAYFKFKQQKALASRYAASNLVKLYSLNHSLFKQFKKDHENALTGHLITSSRKNGF